MAPDEAMTPIILLMGHREDEDIVRGSTGSGTSAIRAHAPQVQEIRAWPDFVLTEVLLGLDVDAPWLEHWRLGSLPTGDTMVDDLLRAAHATPVEDSITSATSIRSLEATQHLRLRSFTLTFAQPLNMRLVGERLLWVAG